MEDGTEEQYAHCGEEVNTGSDTDMDMVAEYVWNCQVNEA